MKHIKWDESPGNLTTKAVENVEKHVLTFTGAWVPASGATPPSSPISPAARGAPSANASWNERFDMLVVNFILGMCKDICDDGSVGCGLET